MSFKRGMYVVVKDIGIGRITKSSWDGYIYVKIDNITHKVKPKSIKDYSGFVGAEYNI